MLISILIYILGHYYVCCCSIFLGHAFGNTSSHMKLARRQNPATTKIGIWLYKERLHLADVVGQRNVLIPALMELIVPMIQLNQLLHLVDL